jgi:hypothetical protein
MLTMEQLVAKYGKHLHPEFHRRLFAWIESMGGLIGIGQTYRAVQPVKPGFAPPGMSFHEKQRFASGLEVVSAADLVALAAKGNPNPAHRSPTWQESATAPLYGVYTFVKNEPWHLQCTDGPSRGYQTWVNAGRPDPKFFTLPGVVPPTPPPVVPPTGKQIDMLILDLNPGTGVWVAMMLAGDEINHLTNGHHVAVMERGGVPRVKVNETEVAGILSSVTTTNASPFAPGKPAHNQALHDAWIA